MHGILYQTEIQARSERQVLYETEDAISTNKDSSTIQMITYWNTQKPNNS